VNLQVTDPDGLTATSEAMITINNVVPTVTTLSASPLTPNEGSPVTFNGTFTDPGTADTHTASWDFGDGSSLSIPLVPTGTRDVSQSHTYGDNGMFTVRLTITDDDGGSGMRDLQIEVRNVPPFFDPPLTNQMVDEGKLLNFTVRAVDPSLVDLLTLTAAGLPPGASFTVPEGMHRGSISGTFAWTPSCAQSGDYPVTFRATDDDGGVVEQTITVTVVETCQVFVYIANRDSDTVSILDSTTNMVGSNLPVGHKPKALTVLPDGSKVYVTNRNEDSVTVIQTGPTAADHRVLRTIWGVGQKPEGVASMPDGEYVWVANRNDDTVSILRRSDDTVIQTVRLSTSPPPSSSGKGKGDEKAGEKKTYEAEEPGGPEKPVAICFAPDGSRAYVTARNSNDLLVMDTAKALTEPYNAVIGAVPVGNKPVALAVSPSGKVIYVVNRSGNSVSVVDAATYTVLATIPVGSEPEGATVTPEGAKVYVTSSATNEVWVFEVHSGPPFLQELRRIPVGQKPAGIATTPAETGLHRAYVANRVDHTVSVIDTTSDSVIVTIPVGNGPVGVAAGLLRTH
jgi:YVTN family beta-propeller protein